MNRLATIFAAAALLPTTALHAQTPSPAPPATSVPIAPPMLPLLTEYHYWPVQFVQWIGNELPYSMIELDVNPEGKRPLLYVTLTDRASGKRIHYTDNDALLAAATATGDESHKAALAYEPADNDNNGSITTIRFTLADGKPLQWRFVQGSDVSEQGSGLSPLPSARIPIFAYREQAAVAGQGTALQIGDTVSTASVWTEISRPPYFVAYRGALSESAHMLVFLPGKQSWTVTSAPAAITVGAAWELDQENGDHRSIHIEKTDGKHITAIATDRFEPGVQCTLEATRVGDSWSIDRARFAPLRGGDKHFLALQFATPLSSMANTTALTLDAGKKRIAEGASTSSGTVPEPSESLSFSDPGWLRGKVLVEQSVSTGKTITLSAHPEPGATGPQESR